MSSLKVLQDLIHEKYGIEAAALDPHASMRDKGFDSLTLVEFVFAIEDHFSISITDDDANSVDTLAGLAAMVDKVRMAQAK
ncbi:phosphopantetheine-binding protein [Variovorax sp. LjRoot290]|jgi:acyl carrier protein|uniref:acyl carrier protein n=1 Tax=unclassified Variovorax TaxID=663243 RepID=UPI0008810A0D|nr:phosphopantetheine-binding protein [Variovorax sp. CF079]SDC81216.1 acyl carrier protein [Variovorax sp. CF079]